MNAIESNPYELATGTIQRLLYEKPLFNYIDNGNVNVVVFGFTLLCRRFIDIAFELAQVNGYKINITVICKDKDAKEQFLSERPAFTQFFDVDDTIIDCSYGHLSFQAVEQNTDIDSMISDVLWDGRTKYAYLFIDCGDDVQNYDIALKCKDCEADLDYRFSIINCALTTNSDMVNSSINIVAKNETIENHNDYAELKRMALNCHLLWNQSEFISIQKLQEEFNSEYNFSSSLSSVLAIKYKLNSVGIDILDENAANKFSLLVNATDTKRKQKIVELIQMEHQRWNVNKICDGWSPMRDLSQCLNGRIDKNKKLHPCLVPCDAKIVLEHNWKAHNHEKWNTAPEEEIQQLDALDQVSVKIHRIFKKKAEEIKSENLLLEHDIYETKKLLSKYSDVDIAFSKYMLCLRELNFGISNQAKLYDYYKNELINALNNKSNNLPKNILENIKSQMQSIESKFFLILESEKYIDYKNTDAKLIKEIPFILTYRTDWHIGIPLNIETGKGVNNQILFDNVSSLLLINPASVTYFCKYSLNEQPQILRALKYAVNCLKMHNVSAKINLCLISDAEIPEESINAFSNLSNRIGKIDTIIYNSEDELENQIIEFINYGDFYAIEKNNSLVSGLLFAFRCYKNNPYYTFNSVKRTLKCYNGYQALSYIPFKAHLKVSDLFEAKGSKDSKSVPDFQQDYEFFWDLYKNNSYEYETKEPDKEKKHIPSERIWKALCNRLYKIDKKKNKSDTLRVNTLNVKNMVAENDEELIEISEPVISILNKLNEKKYITDLKKSEDGCFYSFSYSSQQVKKVLTVAGKVLELYVYYKALECGGFDEVATSVEVVWNKENVGNEFDVIIISGLRSIIIECKAQEKLSQDFYYKLFMLNNTFGINSIPILIADTNEGRKNKADNNMQRSRGNEIGIKTIYKKEDISQIGKILKNLLKIN